jgi:hypothetical protein
MKLVNTLKSLAVTSLAVLGSLGNTQAIAQRNTYIQVTGQRTNNGDLLYLDYSSFFNARNGDIAFRYMVLPQSGKARYAEGVTPYCREGDIDSDVSYRSMPRPGWFVGRNPVIADSPASVALLRRVCNHGYGRIYGE